MRTSYYYLSVQLLLYSLAVGIPRNTSQQAVGSRETGGHHW